MTLAVNPSFAGAEKSAAVTFPSIAKSRAVTWSTVDSGFCVASRAGEFVGSVDATADQGFIAFDGNSSPIGRFETREAAKSAVVNWVPEAHRRRSRVLSARLLPVATAAGLVATVAAAAATMLTIAP